MNISSMKIMKKMYKQPNVAIAEVRTENLMDALLGSPTGPEPGLAPRRRGVAPETPGETI